MKRIFTISSPQSLGFSGCLLSLAALPLSNHGPLPVIGMAVVVIAAIWQVSSSGKGWAALRPDKRLVPYALMMLAFVFTLFSGIYTENMGAWYDNLRIKLPFLILPVAFWLLPGFSGKQFFALAAVFVGVHSLIAALTVGNYYAHFEAVNALIARNKNIEIVTGVGHIYFGIFLAAAIMGGIEAVRGYRAVLFFRGERRVVLFFTILGVLCLHVLTSRTGLVTLYAGLLTYLAGYIVRYRAYWAGLISLAGLMLLPVIAYQLVPSFRLRVDITRWDSKAYQSQDKALQGKQIKVSDLSVGGRYAAWEAAYVLICRHPLIGVGIADIKDETNRYYRTRPDLCDANGVPDPDLPDNPHNQYAEWALGFGPLGLMLLLLLLGWPLFSPWRKHSLLLFAFLAVLATAMLTESYIERQIGIAFFLVGMGIMLQYENYYREKLT